MFGCIFRFLAPEHEICTRRNRLPHNPGPSRRTKTRSSKIMLRFPLLTRFAVALREEHPADDDDVLQEMSERHFLPQLSTAVQRGWVYRYGRMIRNLSGSEDRDRLAPLGGEAVRSSDLRWPSRAIKRALASMASHFSD